MPPAFTAVTLPISLFAIGYPGTERLWILRGFRDQEFGWGDVWRQTLHYIVRFLLLGLIIAPVALVGAGVGVAIARSLVGAFVGLIATSIVADFALTFVTPSLAFTTSSVRDALRTGLRMLVSEWPRNVLYVVVPPLALLLISRLGPGLDAIRDLDREVRKAMHGQPFHPTQPTYHPAAAGLAALAALLGVWFKGATVAFFVRRFVVGPLGSAESMPPRPDAPQPMAPPPDPTGNGATG
ncbi:MAG TPA: hypothetical protein VKA30_00325 [Actinomycetota bacterium]|nr:hypothetical protein [Actinomycetota bacterium]